MSFAACDSMNFLGKEETWRPGIDFNILALEWGLLIILDALFFPFWGMFPVCKTWKEGEFLFSRRAFPVIPTYYISQVTCGVWNCGSCVLFRLLLFREKNPCKGEHVRGKYPGMCQLCWAGCGKGRDGNVAALFCLQIDPMFGKRWIYPNPLLPIISKPLCLKLGGF